MYWESGLPSTCCSLRLFPQWEEHTCNISTFLYIYIYIYVCSFIKRDYYVWTCTSTHQGKQQDSIWSWHHKPLPYAWRTLRVPCLRTKVCSFIKRDYYVWTCTSTHQGKQQDSIWSWHHKPLPYAWRTLRVPCLRIYVCSFITRDYFVWTCTSTHQGKQQDSIWSWHHKPLPYAWRTLRVPCLRWSQTHTRRACSRCPPDPLASQRARCWGSRPFNNSHRKLNYG